MYRGLLERLVFDLRIITIGRSRLTERQMRCITESDRICADKAEEILGNGQLPTPNDKADLAAAQRLAEQIEEFATYLLSQEIC